MSSKLIVQYIQQGKLVLNKTKGDDAFLVRKELNDQKISDQQFSSKYNRQSQKAQSLNSPSRNCNQSQTSSRTIEQFNKTKESKELLDFVIIMSKNNENTQLNATLKFGLINQPIQCDLKIDIINSESYQNFPWLFEQIYSIREKEINKKNNKSFPIQRYIKGKNLSINAPNILHSFQFNQINQNKIILKDALIINYLHRKYTKQPELNPTVVWLSTPKLLEQNKNDNIFIQETDYYSTLENIIEFRSRQKKPWDEIELQNNFYQILHSLNELEKNGIVHANLSVTNIIFAYVPQRYKIYNFQTAQVYNIDHQRKYQIYYTWPLMAPEIQNINQDKKNKNKNDLTHDILALDMYAIGIIFLLMKFLITYDQRTEQIINSKKIFISQDDSLSSIIINTLLTDNPYVRTTNSYEQLCKMIYQNLIQGKQFREIVVKCNQSIRALPPFTVNKYSQSESEYQISKYYFKTFQWQKSIQKIEFILSQIHESEQNSKQYIKCVNNLWKCHYKMKQYETAYKFNLIYFQKRNEHILIPKLRDAFDFQESGRLKWLMNFRLEAIIDFEKGLKILQNILNYEDYEIILALNNIGVLYQVVKQFDTSAIYLNDALNILKNKQLYDDLYTSTLENLATVYNEIRQYELAIKSLKDSLKVRLERDQKKNDLKISKILFNIASLLIKTLQNQEALSYLIDAIQTRERLERFDESLDLEQWRKIYCEIIKSKNISQEQQIQINKEQKFQCEFSQYLDLYKIQNYNQ